MIACRYLLELSEEETAAALGVRRGHGQVAPRARARAPARELGETHERARASSSSSAASSTSRPSPTSPRACSSGSSAGGRSPGGRWRSRSRRRSRGRDRLRGPAGAHAILRFFHLGGVTRRARRDAAAAPERAQAGGLGGPSRSTRLSGVSASSSCCRRRHPPRLRARRRAGVGRRCASRPPGCCVCEFRRGVGS